MPSGNFGYSFNPSQPDIQMPGGAESQGGPGGITPQQAVRILSLRVPERPAPNPAVPLPLMQSKGGAGVPGLDSLVAMLMRAFQGQGSGSGGGGGGGDASGGVFPGSGGRAFDTTPNFQIYQPQSGQPMPAVKLEEGRGGGEYQGISGQGIVANPESPREHRSQYLPQGDQTWGNYNPYYQGQPSGQIEDVYPPPPIVPLF